MYAYTIPHMGIKKYLNGFHTLVQGGHFLTLNTIGYCLNKMRIRKIMREKNRSNSRIWTHVGITSEDKHEGRILQVNL